MQRLTLQPHAPANCQVELVTAERINEAGELLVTEYTQFLVGQAAKPYFQASKRALKTSKATILLIEGTGYKKVDIAQARKLLRSPMPVAVLYRHEDRPGAQAWTALQKYAGSPTPDNEVVWETLARTLRAGTLVFVLSAKDNVPQP
jgi:hypothetical protein